MGESNRNLTLEKRGINMAKKEERFEVIFRDGSQLKTEVSLRMKEFAKSL